MNEQVQCLNAKTKKNLFRLCGEKPIVINLEHVTSMELEEKKIYFFFYAKVIEINFENSTSASSMFECLIDSWSRG